MGSCNSNEAEREHAKLRAYLEEWSMPVPPASCRLWLKPISESGHGFAKNNGAHIYAHRLSWEVSVGPIPSGMSVLHKCDVACCINPDHLFLGTQRENIADMVAKGRQSRGSRRWCSKLTEADVLAIRRRLASGHRQAAIAADYGVKQPVISDISTGKIWTHVVATAEVQP
jgi:hypothetical protein